MIGISRSRLFRLVDGLPLALEMAAPWTNAMSVSDIVAEVERGLDLLQTNMRDVPSRHRSIRAVFDTSCVLWRKVERMPVTETNVSVSSIPN